LVELLITEARSRPSLI